MFNANQNSNNEILNLVVLNEQHSLLPSQIAAIDGEYEIFPIPANGLTLEQQEEVAIQLRKFEGVVIFASPVPVLMGMVIEDYVRCRGAGHDNYYTHSQVSGVGIFHNDLREKKELPGGKIIFTVAKEGWVIKRF